MRENNYQKFTEYLKRNLRKLKPRFSFHYIAYTTLFILIIFSTVKLVSAVTPNPGHPWSELGDGVFVFTNSQTTTPYTYTFPTANTTVLTTNDTVTVGQGGTGLATVAAGSILGYNTLNTASAITSTSGTKVLTNTNGTITWETGGGGMVYPGAGIPNSTGSAWGTSYTTTGSGSVVALQTSPAFTTPSLGVATATSVDFGTTTLLGSRQLTVDTGGTFDINLGTASGDDFTVDTSAFVVEGDTGTILIGTTSTTSNDPAIVVGRNITGTNSINGHAFVDESIINRGDDIGYNSYDHLPTFSGSYNYGHVVGFQSRPTISTSGTFGYVTGGTSAPTINAGGGTTAVTGFSVKDPLGTGTIATVYGFRADELTRGTNNYAIYTAGTTKSYFGGKVGLGTTSPTAYLHLKAGTTTASTAPLKLTAGTNLTNAEAGAMEWDGTNLFITQTSGPTRKTIAYTSDLASYANTTLSNLGTTAINTSLVSDTDSTDDLGSSSSYWANIYTDRLNLNSTSYFDGTTTGTANLTGNLAVDTSVLYVDASANRIGINTTTPSVPLEIVSEEAGLQVAYRNFAASASGAVMRVYKGRGTYATPLRTRSGDVLGGVNAFGYYAVDDSTTATVGTVGGQLLFGTEEAWTSTGQGTYFRIGTTPVGSTSVAERMRIEGSGNVGIGESDPTAVLHLKAGTATAETAPLKFTAGTNLSVVENGAVEYDGSHLYFTTGGTRYQLDQQGGSVSADSLDFTELKDSLVLDDSTSISFGAAALGLTFTNNGSGDEIHNLSSTGDFIIQDNGTPFATFADDGTIVFVGDTTLNTQKDLRFADSDSSNYVAFQAPATVSSNVTWTLPSVDSSGCFKSNGSGTMSIGACGDTNLQTFSSNGNYTIPADALMVIAEGWGGGGGGGAGYSGAVGTVRSGGAGGGGGAYNSQTILASTLGSSGANIPVTIGTGGTASTTVLGAAMDGGAGGRTCLSSTSSCGGTVYVSAYGGGGGNGGSGTSGSGGGGGGGAQSVGLTNATQQTYGTGGSPLAGAAASGVSNSGAGGGHGATAAATGAVGGSGHWGGGGGASSSSTGAGNSGAGGGSYKGGSAGGAGGSIATTYTRRTGGAGGDYLNASGGGGAAGAASDGANGGNGSSDTSYIHGGQGGGGGTTSSATVGGIGGNGGVPGGGGGGGGASNTTSVGSAGGSGGAGYMKIWTLRGSGADLAEIYGTNDDTMSPGDVVALDKNMNAGVQKSSKAYDKDTIGIISTNPGLTIGGVEDPGATPVLVALSGRVPVKVNMENGPIKKGDYLTASSVPGVAMRATKAGTIIGQAMTEYIDENEPSFVVAFIKSGPSNGVKLAEIIPGLSLLTDEMGSNNVDDVDIEEDIVQEVENTEQETEGSGIITPQETIQKIALRYFLANKIELEKAVDISEIYTDRLSAALEIITPTVIADTISTNSIITSTGEVIAFNSPSAFNVPPLFNRDTAGFAIIKEGDKRVRVEYEKPYISEPVVQAGLAFSVLDNISDIFANDLFEKDIKSIILDNDENGFTILIDKEAPRDLRFSWTALAVNDPKVFESVVDGLTFDDIAEDSDYEEDLSDTTEDIVNTEVIEDTEENNFDQIIVSEDDIENTSISEQEENTEQINNNDDIQNFLEVEEPDPDIEIKEEEQNIEIKEENTMIDSSDTTVSDSEEPSL